MTYEITLTPENHGYTIRLEKRSYSFNEKKQSIEKSETVGTLAIIWEHKEAIAVFEMLNTFISTCVKHGIFKEALFRYRNIHPEKKKELLGEPSK